MSADTESIEKLATLVHASGLRPLSAAQLDAFGQFLALLTKWNARLNLTAIREADSILGRHFVECIAVAQALPEEIATLLDFGSGAGFPGIPIALFRPGITVTLAESQGKKAAFLQEAVRSLGIAARVHAGRAEDLAGGFDCVTLRAVDRMEAAVAAAASLGNRLAVLTTQTDLERVKLAAGAGFTWHPIVGLPGSEQRILALATRLD